MRSSQRGAALALLLLPSVVSCTTTVRPSAAVSDPATVVVLTHGISSSLVLPDDKGGSVRFAYGDWRYYALGRTGICETAAALLWPTRAALGRQVIGRDAIAAVPHDEAHLITAEARAVTMLRSKLEALFLERIETKVYNPEPRLEFVVHPQPYSFWNNSNRQVARWLGELGATVRGVPLLPKWRVVKPRGGDAIQGH